MYPKTKCEALVARTSKEYIRLLNLSHLNIHIHVKRSTKELKTKIVHAECLIQDSRPRRVDIIIYYDKAKGMKDVKASVFHELLHVKMRLISGLVHRLNNKKYPSIYHHLEEQLVRDVEKFFLAKMK